MITSYHCSIFLWFYIVCLSQYFNLIHGANTSYFDAQRALVTRLTNESKVLKEILPAHNINTPVDLKLNIQLRQIATVDEKNQAIRLTVWLNFHWNNPFLKWDPQEYEGIKSVHANNEFFWVPDVALFNEASLEEEIDILYKRLATKLVITHNGNCSWNSPAALLSQCRIDVSRFPFDEQECNVSIGSWTYNGYKINISYYTKDADMRNFIPNGEWEVQSAVLENNLKPYGTEKIPYPDVTLVLRIKRRTLYYSLNLIIPCALIALLALLSFILPSNHGERVSLVITVLLANSVYMLIVSSSLPETSDAVPTLGIFCLGIIVEIALCLFATCLTYKVWVMTTPMPDWVETLLIDFIARIVRVNVEESLPQVNSAISLSINNEKFTKITEDKSLDCGREENTKDVSLVELKKRKTKSLEECLMEEVRVLTDELRLKHEDKIIAKKWKQAAKILDRFFLLIFFVIYLCLIIFLLASM